MKLNFWNLRGSIFVALFIFLINSNCFSQIDSVEKKTNYGFYFSALSNKFQNEDNNLIQKYNSGFGLGLFFIIKINNDFNLNLAIQAIKEYHKFEYNSAEFKLKEIGLSVPLEIQYNLLNKKLFATSGMEYSNVHKYVTDQQIKLNRDNFDVFFGFLYNLKLQNFTVSSQIKYSRYINNSLGNINGSSGSESILNNKSGYTFSIKIM